MLSSLALPDAVRELAQRLGRDDDALPAYVYDLDGLAAHTAGIRAALPDRVELCYAVKANPDPAVLRAVARHADGLEVSSAGELRHAGAAVPGARLSFGGPGKTAAELAAAIAAGTFRFHVESLHELRLLGSAALAAGREAEILLRVNLPAPDAALARAVPGIAALADARPDTGRVPGSGTGPIDAAPARAVPGGTALADALPDAGRVPGFGGGPVGVAPDGGGGLVMGGQPTPFGMDLDVLDRCGEWLSAGSVESRRLRLRGVHAHLASGLAAPALLGSALRVLEFARGWCAARGVRDPEFNLGGGMAVDYRRPDARFDWASFGRGLACAARPGETLRVEPGRAVTAYCGWYVTRVLDLKRSQGRTFAVVAGGTHHLRTPVAKGHDQPFVVVPVAGWPHDWPRPAAAGEPVTIVGQLCTPKDVLARDVPLSRLRAADLVAFGLAGAYAWNISHHDFLMHPSPGFHYVGTGFRDESG